MQTYDTLVDALNDLKQRGYNIDFNLAFDHVKCQATGVCLAPSQFESALPRTAANTLAALRHFLK